MWCSHPVLSGTLCVVAGAALMFGAIIVWATLADARDARQARERARDSFSNA